jgi:hypothetical protein
VFPLRNNHRTSRIIPAFQIHVPHPAGKLSGSASPGAEALDLASLGRRDVVRTASHLAHEPLLLHLAAEFPKGLLELLGILDDYSHNPTRIPIEGRLRSVKPLLQHVRGNRRRGAGHFLREHRGDEFVTAI